MDKSRYTEINGIEAINLFLEGEELLNEEGQKHRIDPTFNKLYYVPWAHEVLSDLSFNEIASRKWYVKKPFDVRAEMLARPNEWVGAFKRDDGKWVAIGFDLDEFEVSTIAVSGTNIATPKESILCQMLESSRYLDLCIPIEDVPKEEWK